MNQTVDILIPTYNRRDLLEQCLQSLLTQSYQNFKVYIYDDGGNDDSYLIAKEFSEKGMDILFVKGAENNGVAYARNMLLTMGHSDYCMWQDSDDIAHNRRVEKMLGAIIDQKVDVVFSDMFFFKHPAPYRNTHTVHSVDIKKYVDRNGLYNNMNFATAIFKRSIGRLRFDTNLRRREDVKWLEQLIKKGTKFGYVQIPLYYCRRHDGRLTTKK
jgi:glycosyltransferase involved in cell wall biosynthesis